MPVSAIINERRLQRRFDPCYFCQINVASQLAFVFGLKVEFLNLGSVNHHNAGFFRVGGVDKHLFSHVFSLHRGNRRTTCRRADCWGCLVRAKGGAADRCKAAIAAPGPDPVSCARLIAFLSPGAFMRTLYC